jgi:hypothetical protein
VTENVFSIGHRGFPVGQIWFPVGSARVFGGYREGVSGRERECFRQGQIGSVGNR